MNNDVFSINDYLNKSFLCECGKVHSAPIKHILLKENALFSLTPLIKNNGFKKPFLLFDINTSSIAKASTISMLEQENQPYEAYVLTDADPVPDEHTIGEILIHFDPSCDLMIGVGSGTINDMSRFISYKLGIPYMILATAPSMDGFASNVAPLIVNHMKTTYEAHIPYAILGDTELLKDAPMKMIAAGIGDILGKYTCLCDWEIAHIITGEYHCRTIEDMVRKSLNAVVNNLQEAGSRNPAAIQNIMEALVLSGIAMSFAGNSRPASGSEHHLSHYWEMMFLFEGKQPVLHGTKVGIGTVAVIRAYELLMNCKIDFDKAAASAEKFNRDSWEAFMKKAYGKASASVITLEQETGKNDPSHVITRIKQLEKHWELIKAIIGRLPSADIVYHYLKALKAPADPMSVGIDKETFMNSFLAAKELRNRYGLLQILFDLGLAEEIAEKVWDYFQTNID